MSEVPVEAKPRRRWTALRITFVALGLLLTLIFAVMTFTVPAIVATAPALLMLGFAAMTYIAWPKKH